MTSLTKTTGSKPKLCLTEMVVIVQSDTLRWIYSHINACAFIFFSPFYLNMIHVRTKQMIHVFFWLPDLILHSLVKPCPSQCLVKIIN